MWSKEVELGTMTHPMGEQEEMLLTMTLLRSHNLWCLLAPGMKEGMDEKLYWLWVPGQADSHLILQVYYLLKKKDIGTV